MGWTWFSGKGMLWTGITVAFLIGLGLNGMCAEEKPLQSNVFTLGEIEVSDKADVSKNITVEKITSEEMKDFTREKLGEALNLLPGVTFTHNSRNETGVYVRGFDTKRVPLFLDGIPIYVPNDGYSDYGRFSTFDLSEIVVSKGFTSVLYGPNTMGGAVNLVTRRPEKPFEGDAGIGYGTGNTYRGYINLGARQGKWYFQGGGSHINSDYFTLSKEFDRTRMEDGGQRENSYYKDSKISMKIGFVPAEGHEYALSYINQQGKKGNPPDTNGSSTSSRFWEWPKWDKESYYFTSRTALGEKSYVKGRFYYDTYTNVLDSFTDGSYSTYASQYDRSYYDDYTFGGSIEAGTTLIPRNNLKFAAHFKRDTHKEYNRRDRNGNMEPEQRADDALLSLGAEDTIDITKKLYVIAGVSYDKQDGLRAQEWDDRYRSGRIRGRLLRFDPDDTDAWNPQFGLFYLMTETGKLHASVEKKTRFPSIKDRYSSTFGSRIANPSLKPEKAVNYEVGYEDVFLKKIRFKTTVFYNDITNQFQNVRVPDPDNPGSTVQQQQNIGKVEQYGMELEALISVTKDLEGGFNYTYLYRDNRSSSDKLTSVPENKFFMYAKYETPIKNLSLLGDIEYDSMRWCSSDGSTRAKGFVVANAKAMYEIIKGLKVEAGVSNVFDKDYELSDGYPEAGRNYFMNLRYSF
ncbi:MAG: FhuE receptor precursor [Syntrophorhabdus sp. PtaB.Bin006]|nr:MAG: FhuE receptor precursor [Syntrophorhabdus sp. PtaB.Bin006]